MRAATYSINTFYPGVGLGATTVPNKTQGHPLFNLEQYSAKLASKCKTALAGRMR